MLSVQFILVTVYYSDHCLCPDISGESSGECPPSVRREALYNSGGGQLVCRVRNNSVSSTERYVTRTLESPHLG